MKSCHSRDDDEPQMTVQIYCLFLFCYFINNHTNKRPDSHVCITGSGENFSPHLNIIISN